MISTTTQNNLKTFLIKFIKTIIVLAFWLVVWELVSRAVSRDNELMLLILPGPKAVFDKWLQIAFTKPYLTAVASSLLRIFGGFLLGLVIGFALGVLTHFFKIFDLILSPMIRVIRAVPVIAISILLFLFFESHALPVCVVCLMVIPIIWQTVYDGLGSPDKALIEMASVYKLSKFKSFLYIKLPCLLPALLSASVTALGIGFKSGIAAEVISLPKNSLGTIMWQSKGAVFFDEVYAVTLTVVILSIVIEFVIKGVVNLLLRKGGKRV